MLTPTLPESLRKTVEMPAILLAAERYSDLECAVLCHLAEEVGRPKMPPSSLNTAIREDLKTTQEWSVEMLDELVTFD